MWLRIDTIEGALARSSLRIESAEDAGYLAAYALAADNLAARQSVIADSVNPIALTRKAWRRVGTDTGCRVLEVEIVCSDPSVHRARVEARHRAAVTGREPDWARVASRTYEPHSAADLRIDTATTPVDVAAGRIADRVARV